MKSWIVILGLMVTLSCSSDDDFRGSIYGNYAGTFQRGDKISNVEITLDKAGRFSGASDKVKFPAICKGDYEIENATILFKDECAWTAEFDWSLILSGNWNFSFRNNSLILINSLGDKYTLKKQ